MNEEEAQRAQGIGIRCIFRSFERDLHVALSCKIVDLSWLHLLHNPDESGRITQVAVMESKVNFLLVWVLIEVVDAARVE